MAPRAFGARTITSRLGAVRALGNLVTTLTMNSDRFDRGIGRAVGGLTALKGVGVAAGIAIGASLIQGLQEAAAERIQFQYSMQETFNLLPQMSQSAMDRMSETVRNFARATATTLQDAAEAAYQATSAGIVPSGLEGFLAASDNLAKAWRTDLPAAVTAVNTALNAYGKEAHEAGEVSDKLFTIVQKGVVRGEELNTALSKVLPVAADFGVSMDEIGAALAALTRQGSRAAEASTQIRQIMVQLARQGSKADKVFRQIAGTSFPLFIKNGGSIKDALELIKTHTENTGQTMFDVFGRVEAASAALTLTSKAGAANFVEGMEAMENSQDNVADAAERMRETTLHGWNAMKADIGSVTDRVGPALVGIADAMADIGRVALSPIKWVVDIVYNDPGWEPGQGVTEPGKVGQGTIGEAISKGRITVVDERGQRQTSFGEMRTTQSSGWLVDNPHFGKDPKEYPHLDPQLLAQEQLLVGRGSPTYTFRLRGRWEGRDWTAEEPYKYKVTPPIPTYSEFKQYPLTPGEIAALREGGSGDELERLYAELVSKYNFGERELVRAPADTGLAAGNRLDNIFENQQRTLTSFTAANEAPAEPTLFPDTTVRTDGFGSPTGQGYWPGSSQTWGEGLITHTPLNDGAVAITEGGKLLDVVFPDAKEETEDGDGGGGGDSGPSHAERRQSFVDGLKTIVSGAMRSWTGADLIPENLVANKLSLRQHLIKGPLVAAAAQVGIGKATLRALIDGIVDDNIAQIGRDKTYASSLASYEHPMKNFLARRVGNITSRLDETHWGNMGQTITTIQRHLIDDPEVMAQMAVHGVSRKETKGFISELVHSDRRAFRREAGLEDALFPEEPVEEEPVEPEALPAEHPMKTFLRSIVSRRTGSLQDSDWAPENIGATMQAIMGNLAENPEVLSEMEDQGLTLKETKAFISELVHEQKDANEKEQDFLAQLPSSIAREQAALEEAREAKLLEALRQDNVARAQTGLKRDAQESFFEWVLEDIAVRHPGALAPGGTQFDSWRDALGYGAGGLYLGEGGRRPMNFGLSQQMFPWLGAAPFMDSSGKGGLVDEFDAYLDQKILEDPTFAPSWWDPDGDGDEDDSLSIQRKFGDLSGFGVGSGVLRLVDAVGSSVSEYRSTACDTTKAIRDLIQVTEQQTEVIRDGNEAQHIDILSTPKNGVAAQRVPPNLARMAANA